MIRFEMSARVPIALLLLAIGSGTLTAGVFDLFKSSDKKLGKNAVVRAQEPNPAPPAPLDIGEDPAYTQPALPVPTAEPAPSVSTYVPTAPAMDCAPQFSGFSDGGNCHVCLGCREPQGCCNRCAYGLGKSSRRITGQSYYCDCYPLFGPRYGFYTTCWRRLPEDCRCPIFIPPRKSNNVPNPIPTDDPTLPVEPEVPAPPKIPQAFNFR